MYGGKVANNASLSVDATSELIIGGGKVFEIVGTLKGDGLFEVVAGEHTLPTTVIASQMTVVIQEGALIR